MNAAARPARLPYPGLRPFRSDETDLFFGRESCTDQMVDRLAATHFLAVIGSSGSGKSSLVRTGLLDALEFGLLAQAGSRWLVADLRPASTPISNLAEALLAAGREGRPAPAEPEILALAEFLRRGPRSIIEWCLGGNLPAATSLLILADQFEELFRYTDYTGQQEAEAFVALLIESAGSRAAPIYIVITMRSEYLGPCALIPDLAEQINEGLYLTRRMTREETREAIVGPASVCGFALEPALVNRLLNDLVSFAPWDAQNSVDRLQVLARRADQLPLMQHVLNRLWMQARAAAEHSGPIVLKDADYRALGGLGNALSAHADEVLDSLGGDKDVAQTIFRALISGGSVATAIRQPRRFGELVALAGGNRAAAARVVDAFRDETCNFLLTSPAGALTDRTVVDISHESLIRQWRTLSNWLLDEARSAGQYRDAEAQATRWQAKQRGYLRDEDLRDALAWRDREKPSWVWAKRYSTTPESEAGFLATMEFIRSSGQRWRRGRATRRLAGLGVAAAACLVAVFAGGKAFEAYAQTQGDAYYFGQDERQDYDKAMKWYKRAAWFGNADAERHIGLLYDQGNGVKQDDRQAMIWYRKAAAAGDPRAEYDLGSHYAHGEGVSQDYAQAMDWFQKAKGGDEHADLMIGVFYDEGDGVKKDYGQAMSWYMKAENLALPSGDAVAENNIGNLYYYGNGVPQDYSLAMFWYQKSAAQNDDVAEYNIGNLYWRGNGVPQDYAQALVWYQKAAAQDNANAEYWIGNFYEYGYGVKRDYAEALTWYKRAEKDGYPEPYLDIGLLYDNGGYGVTQNYQQAKSFYLKALTSTDQSVVADAELGLGYMYDAGNGVRPDRTTAHGWYLKAASLGSLRAENNIGADYEFGDGVKQDIQQAIIWFKKAAAGHDPRSDESLGDIYSAGEDVREEDGLATSQAIFWYERTIEDARSQDLGYNVADVEWKLAKLYMSGTSKDMFKAMPMLRKAANDGSPEAEESLGNYYVDPQSQFVNTDYAEAKRLFSAAADSGLTSADIDIALLYLNGHGVPQDDKKALTWLLKANNSESIAEIEDDIGERYANGDGVSQDKQLALKWFTKAAADGSSDAAEQAGYLYLQTNEPVQAAAAFALALKIDQAVLAKNPGNAGDMGDVAWHLILNKQPKAAAALSKAAIAAAPDQVWLETNLADALMIEGQFASAKAIYLKYKSVQDAGTGVSWKDDVLSDFGVLKRLGYNFPLMADIAKALGG